MRTSFGLPLQTRPCPTKARHTERFGIQDPSLSLRPRSMSSVDEVSRQFCLVHCVCSGSANHRCGRSRPWIRATIHKLSLNETLWCRGRDGLAMMPEGT